MAGGIGQSLRELQEQIVALTGRVQALEEAATKPKEKPKK